MAKRKDSLGQQCIDFSARGVQLALLTKARLPKAGGVSGMKLKAVLREIDNYARGGVGWPSYQTLADGVQMSYGQVRRAVAALVNLSLICVDRVGVQSDAPTRRSCNHYRIVWSEVALLAADQVRILGVSSALLEPIKCASGAHLTALKRNEPPPPTPKQKNQDPWKAAAAAFKDAGIGSTRCLVAILKEAGVSPEEAQSRLVAGRAVIQRLPGTFKSPIGALCHWIENASWPVDGIDSQPEPERVNLDHHWPAIMAMTDDERMSLLPPGMARERYEVFGPHVLEVRWTLLHAYDERTKHQLATA